MRIVEGEKSRSASHKWENVSKSSETRSSATHKLLSFLSNLSLASKIKCSAKAARALKCIIIKGRAVSSQSCH